MVSIQWHFQFYGNVVGFTYGLAVDHVVAHMDALLEVHLAIPVLVELPDSPSEKRSPHMSHVRIVRGLRAR